MSDAADPRRAAARLLWSDPTLSLTDISRRVGAARITIMTWAIDDAWTGRPFWAVGKSKSPSKARGAKAAPNKSPEELLRRRLLRLVNHNVKMMEQRKVSDENDPQSAEPDRNMRVIGNTVRSIEKLKDLGSDPTKRDTAATATGRYPLTPEEEDRLRNEIVERLIKLRQRRRDEGGNR